MSDDELSRIERAIKRYLSYYWWLIIPSVIGATAWVTHQNTLAEQTKQGMDDLKAAFTQFATTQQDSALKTQHVTDELARHEWTAANHENRLQWLEHRTERP